MNPAPGGGTSATFNFSVNNPVPAIASLAPSIVPVGHAATITITGTGFEANSVVQWNGSARPTTFVSTTQLKVDLTAADLQTTGSLTVNNPGPSAATSPAAPLAVTSQPIPMIQSVVISNGSGPGGSGNCPFLQVTITGQNFNPDSVVLANSTALQSVPTSPNTVIGNFPVGFVSQPGALTFSVMNAQGVVSDPFAYPTASPAALALCASPSPTTVFAASSFSFTVQPTEINISGNVAVTLGALPAGITTGSNSIAVPPSGATVHFNAASTTVAGVYDLLLNGVAGGTTAKGDFNFTVSTAAPPGFFFQPPLQKEVGVPIGGSGSIVFGTQVNSNTSLDFDVTPSVTGLPPGTTATFSPAVVTVGTSVTVNITAASSAPVSQNVDVTLVGTPAANTPVAQSDFLVDVTQPPGSLPNSRTDFVSTAGTPYAAVYDATHNLIFSSNPDWNRVDVISNVTHKIVKSISVRSPRGIDITPDGAQVWVQTASTNLYSINTASLHAKHYQLPSRTFTSSGLRTLFFGDRLLALSDGTLFVFFDDFGATNSGIAGIWNPQTNQLTVLANGTPSAWGFPARSGDGTVVYASNVAPGTGVEVYKVATQALSTVAQGTNLPPVAAVNRDGSQLVLGATSLALYDRNLALLGSLPGELVGFGVDFPLEGGVLFSSDNTKIYENGSYNGQVVILTIDASTRTVIGTAPSGIIEPVATSGAAGTATPFAIDSTGIVLGIQTYGIAFDDSTFFQHYAAVNQPGQNGSTVVARANAGPLAGGTVVDVFASPFLIPDVWFGQNRGVINSAQGQLTVTSPPSSVPGPVNLKLIFPDGIQYFDPQYFSYSTFPEYAVTSGSSPDGGAPAQLIGTGLPTDPSGGTLKIGPNTASITPPATQNIPFSGEPYPSTILSYTFPAGSPGRADLQVTTPNGTGTLPKSIFYAKSVTDYSSPDSFTAVLVDEPRKQVYLSAGDHVDVFSTVTNQFVTALHPAARGAQVQFTGLALTPDGRLLVADLRDSSLAVINPDSPSTTYAIALPPAVMPINNCSIGPLYVAATSANKAFVSFGSLPAPSCPANGFMYIADLQTRTAVVADCSGGEGVDAPADGSFVAIEYGTATLCIESPPNFFPSTLSPTLAIVGGIGVAVSGDGNVIGTDETFYDVNANALGSVAQPVPFYGNSVFGPPSLLLRPRLNASGSLYYLSFPNYFEIIDVPTARLRMRFSLTQTISNVAAPLAVDSGGRHVYLLTDKGLTVVDFGAAPLSIGHVSQQNPAPGAQVMVRGSGFDSATTATVGGVAASVTFTDENTLTLTIPAAPSGPQDIVLTRTGGETYTLENAVVLP